MGSRQPAPSQTRRPKRLLALLGDERLISYARAGDQASFEVLYERHVAGVLSFCRHMLGSREEAEDAVQVTFASAHRAIHRDRRAIRFKAWLYTIARRECLTTLRARRASETPNVEPSTAGLADEVEHREDLRALLSDLADLPDLQRAALVLTELEDLSHHEVAQVLECEAWQVKGLVFRARTGLIERRDARDARCEDIRAELAEARGGAMKRARLRHHLHACPGCTAYLADLRAQRRRLSALLPVMPTVALHQSALGTGAAVTASGPLTAGGLAAWLGGTSIAKVAAVGVLAAGTGAGAAGVRELGAERVAGVAPRVEMVDRTERRAVRGATPSQVRRPPARSPEAAEKPDRRRTRSGATRPATPPRTPDQPDAVPHASPSAADRPGAAPSGQRRPVALPAADAPRLPTPSPLVEIPAPSTVIEDTRAPAIVDPPAGADVPAIGTLAPAPPDLPPAAVPQQGAAPLPGGAAVP